MIDLNSIVYTNKVEAINKLKKVPQMQVTFCENVDEPQGDEPYVIMDLGNDGELSDNMVIAAKYTEEHGIEILVGVEWLPISYCLAYSENNIYMAIDTLIN